MVQEPLSKPSRTGKPLNPAAQEIPARAAPTAPLGFAGRRLNPDGTTGKLGGGGAHRAVSGGDFGPQELQPDQACDLAEGRRHRR